MKEGPALHWSTHLLKLIVHICVCCKTNDTFDEYFVVYLILMKSQLDIHSEVPVLEVDQGNGVNEMHQTPTAVPNFTQ